jgi:hypothetical protein
MNSERPFTKEFILQKISARHALTREEEYYYLTEILGFGADEAGVIVTVSDYVRKPLNNTMHTDENERPR